MDAGVRGAVGGNQLGRFVYVDVVFLTRCGPWRSFAVRRLSRWNVFTVFGTLVKSVEREHVL